MKGRLETDLIKETERTEEATASQEILRPELKQWLRNKPVWTFSPAQFRLVCSLSKVSKL
jgi:hypothetical protein